MNTSVHEAAVKGSSDETELSILFPEDGKVTINNEEIVIRPIKFKQIKQVLKLAEGLKGRKISLMQEEPVIDASGKAHIPASSPLSGLTYSEMLSIINDNSELVTEALAVAISKPVDFVDALEVTDVVKLLAIVLKVNADFFTTHALPLIMKILEDVTPQLVSMAGRKLQ